VPVEECRLDSPERSFTDSILSSTKLSKTITYLIASIDTTIESRVIHMIIFSEKVI